MTRAQTSPQRATPADGQLRALIERVIRLKEEQDALAADIREIYAEAKGTGFDKTAMGQLVAHLRKVEKVGVAAVEEGQTVFDLYLSAYQRATGTVVATHTHETAVPRSDAGLHIVHHHTDINQNPLPAHDSDGVIIEDPPETADEMDRATEGSFETGSGEAENAPKAIPAGPEAGSVSHAGGGGSPAANHRVMSMTPLEPRNLGGLKGFGFTVSFADHSSEPVSSPVEADKPGAVLPDAPGTLSDDDVPAFLKEKARDPLNERCEKPLTCKFGRHPHKITCSTCFTAWMIEQRKVRALA